MSSDASSSLGRSLAVRTAALVIAIAVVALLGVWGVLTQRQDAAQTLAAQRQLRRVYEIGQHLATAQTLLRSTSVDPSAALGEVRRATAKHRAYFDNPAADATTPDAEPPTPFAAPTGFGRAMRDLAAADSLDSAGLLRQVRVALHEQAVVAAEIRARIDAARGESESRLRTAVALVLGVATAAALAGIVLAVALYRSVARPVGQLADGVARVAGRRFAEPIAVRGPAELARLAASFNDMARQLDELYRDLNRRVEEKSRALAMSQRLASVGFLAAGVAHEINNPLAIIAGYAERALAEIEDAGGSTDAGAAPALAVIRDEAFRCKKITEKLLSLARPAGASRENCDAASVCREVARLAEAHPSAAGRVLRVEVGPEPAWVAMSAGELKQVLLNLLLNAMDATSAADGRVELRMTHAKEHTTIAVSDNGRGIAAADLARVFEPFFSVPRPDRGDRVPGTGLGLAIAQAIAAANEATLSASSGGPGCGAEFVLTLRSVTDGASA